MEVESSSLLSLTLKPWTRYGKRMKAIAAAVNQLGSEDADKLEAEGSMMITPDDR